VYERKGDYDRAIGDFTQAIIKIDPEDEDYYLSGDAYRQRGEAYARKKDYDRALGDFTQAIKINPEDGDAYLVRGAAYLDKKDYDRAIGDLTQAIKFYVLDEEYAYYCRGLAYSEKGQKDKAAADFEEVLNLLPSRELAEKAQEKLKQLRKR
jgi:tetratricopeptide (TPR) repeat protein